MTDTPGYPSGRPDWQRLLAQYSRLTAGYVPPYSPPSLHQQLQAAAQAYSPANLLKLTEGAAQAYSPANLQQLAKAVAQANSPANLQQLAKAVAQANSPANLQQLAKAVAQANSPANLQQLAKAVAQANSPANLQQLAKAVAQANSPANLQQQLQAVAQAYSPQNLTRALTQTYSQENLALLRENISRSLANVVKVAAATDWAEAAERFEAELAASGDAPLAEEEPRVPLGWWLSTRPLVVQLGLLQAALVALEKATRLLEELSGQDIPDPLQATTEVVVAVSVFLLLYLQERHKTD